MAKVIKVKCNGPSKHVNEINLDKALGETVVLRGGPEVKQSALQAGSVPERLVLNCQFWSEGKVILTRDMVEENL